MYTRFILFFLFALLSLRVHAADITVSAASSLTNVLEEVGRAYTRTNPKTTVRFNFAASGILQRQIAQGAPVDVFLSASEQEVDALQRAGSIVAETRLRFATNRLALIAPANSPFRRWEDLTSPAIRRIALSNPETVPSGRYAKETLIKKKLWEAVQPKLVFGENVRQTLTYVATRDADAGMVFVTDAKQESKRVKIVKVAEEGKDHTSILYTAVVVKQAPNPSAARAFVTFLKSKEAGAVLKRYGFTPFVLRVRIAGDYLAAPATIKLKNVQKPRRK